MSSEIKIINNIFTDEQRKKLIDDVQPLILYGINVDILIGSTPVV